MSDRIQIPNNKREAEKVMLMFGDNAHNLKYQKQFEEAINILYGEFYMIKYDMNKRMLFFCEACHKEMNSDKALFDHSKSGTHLKNADRMSREKKILPTKSKFSPHSLQHLLKTHSQKVLGMQLIESYVNDKGTHYYYKCLLCGAHGRKDAMYKHFIGVKHTDAYIKARTVLKCSTITPKERDVLREMIYKKDGITVDYIKQYRGDKYFPFLWEAEGSSKKDQRNPNKRLKCQPRSDDVKEDEPIAGPSGVTLSSEQQTKFYKEYLDNIFKKLYCIYNWVSKSESAFKNKDDIITMFKVLQYTMLLIFFASKNSSSQKNASSHYEQKKLIESCFGQMREYIEPEIKRLYGINCLFNW